MRCLLALVLLVGCAEVDDVVTEDGAATGPLGDAWRVPCGTQSPAGRYQATFRRWGGWYVECAAMPESITVQAEFDGASWCSLAWSTPHALADCRDFSCVPGPTSTEAGRVEVALHCGDSGPQRYYMTVTPR